VKTMQAYRFALDLTPSQERTALARVRQSFQPGGPTGSPG
jgi:hypothetical protein